MILVVGATGRVGTQVVRMLGKLGQDVRALVRRGSHYYRLNDTGCTYFFGDLRDPDSLSQACRDVRHIIWCAQPGTQTRGNSRQAVLTDGIARLTAAARTRDIQRFVMISCLVAENQNVPAAMQAWSQAENIVRTCGISHTILRSGVHEQWLIDLADEMRNGRPLRLTGTAEGTLCPIATSDLALMAAACLDHPSAHNQILRAVGPDRVAASEALRLACAHRGTELQVKKVSTVLLSAAKHLVLPIRRRAERIEEDSAWLQGDDGENGMELAQQLGVPLTALDQALVEATELRSRQEEGPNPELVSRAIRATVYEPNSVAQLKDLPDGPARRKR